MKKILIVYANYYPNISKSLRLNSEKILKREKVKFKSFRVTGVFEIPVVISKYIHKYDACIALGCVIKGETSHYDFICNSTFNSIMNIAVKNKKPIGNGIITVDNLTQASKRKNKKGIEAAKAVTSILFNEPK
tara:strand:- start:103 stop:501 length:399 start_codon:yes stop_codon:yes gene_type:complete